MIDSVKNAEASAQEPMPYAEL
ncbi:MAG: hypothetical protein JWO27_2792, partial [Frankiales bacterium]|nr:hypothetical protein [Frankiales bacterium]